MLCGVAAAATAFAVLNGVGRGDQAPVGASEPPVPDVQAAMIKDLPGAGSLQPAGIRIDRDAATDVTDQDAALPSDSGAGYRVVFSEGRQRVWLVDGDETVVRTYPVSGSIYDNLDPGTYEVFSTSRHAVGIDDSGTMEYFVRFTYGDQGAAIGFHTIPVDDGAPVQTEGELGTPLSHGCIRQREDDAIALWDFSPIGTTVVVTA